LTLLILITYTAWALNYNPSLQSFQMKPRQLHYNNPDISSLEHYQMNPDIFQFCIKGSAILAFAGLQNLHRTFGPTFEQKKIMTKNKVIWHIITDSSAVAL